MFIIFLYVNDIRRYIYKWDLRKGIEYFKNYNKENKIAISVNENY